MINAPFVEREANALSRLQVNGDLPLAMSRLGGITPSSPWCAPRDHAIHAARRGGNGQRAVSVEIDHFNDRFRLRETRNDVVTGRGEDIRNVRGPEVEL